MEGTRWIAAFIAVIIMLIGLPIALGSFPDNLPSNYVLAAGDTITGNLQVNGTTTVTDLVVTGTTSGLPTSSGTSCTLPNMQAAVSNDFHNLGGTDDDTPDNDSEVPDTITLSNSATVPLAVIQKATSSDFHNIGGTDDDTPDSDAEVPDAITVTAQAGSTWNVADSINPLSVGTGGTSLEETTGAADSGATLIGVFDEFDNSNSANVQAVLNDLDAAITAAGTPTASGTHSVTSIVVVAADSPAWARARATYTTDGDGGTDDSVTFEAAMAAGGTGSTITFMPGSYYPKTQVDGSWPQMTFNMMNPVFDWQTADALFEITGSLGDSFNLSAATVPGTRCVYPSSDPSGSIAVGDWVLVRSEDTEQGSKIGEVHKVKAVTASKITLHEQIIDTYTTSPAVQEVNMIDGIVFTGNAYISDDDPANGGEYGISLWYCSNADISGMHMLNISDEAIALYGCVNSDVHGNYIEGAATAGQGYGLSEGYFSSHNRWYDNDVRYCRHGFSGNDGATTYGSPHWTEIYNNSFLGNLTTVASIDFHESVSQNINVHHNTIHGGYDGIRLGAQTWTAEDNEIYCDYLGISDRGDASVSIKLSDNKIPRSQTAILLDATTLLDVTIDGVPVCEGTYRALRIDPVANSLWNISGMVSIAANADYSKVEIYASSTPCVVNFIGNTITNAWECGVWAKDITGGIFSDNTIADNNKRNDSYYSNETGLLFEDVTNVIANANRVYDDDGGQNNGIREYGPRVDHNIISSNICYGSDEAQVEVAGGSSTAVNNVINQSFVASGGG